jgi:hypothetical protein
MGGTTGFEVSLFCLGERLTFQSFTSIKTNTIDARTLMQGVNALFPRITTHFVNRDFPEAWQQKNTKDCGVYVCLFAKRYIYNHLNLPTDQVEQQLRAEDKMAVRLEMLRDLLGVGR